MNYPTIGHKQLSPKLKRVFRGTKSAVKAQMRLDNKENEMSLSLTDIEILAWNATTRFVVFVQRNPKSLT